MSSNRLDKLRSINKKKENSVTDKEALKDLVMSDIRNIQSTFDYDSLGIDSLDKNLLIDFEKGLLVQGKRLGEIAYEIGDILEKARAVFNRYAKSENDPSFMMWYQNVGLNKDQVSIFTKRYQLCLSYKDKKETILSLTDHAVKLLSNKKTPEIVLEKVLSGEVKTAREIKEANEKAISKIFEIEEVVDFDVFEKNSIWINKKNKEEYKVISLAIDATNSRDGLSVVLYLKNNKYFVRDRAEFLEKFYRKHNL
ncbi:MULTISPECIES: hypothetical protein [unclassified Cetobacterium]|uniref:hypothetical protein n=1 Tax=unclassified Cetobacterium TaxID=2630983 RepID=UPI0021064BFB|nr:hypothetical protein [Cetobacterium sp. 2A]